MGDQRVRVEREAPAPGVVVARWDDDLEGRLPRNLPGATEGERASGRRQRLDLGVRLDERRRRDLERVGRGLVGDDDPAAREEERHEEREPQRDAADHPDCSSTDLSRACALLHCASCGPAVASTAFGFPRCAWVTTPPRPWLQALNVGGDRGERRALRRELAPRRLGARVVARQLAPLPGERADARLRLAQRPPAGRERLDEGIRLPRALVEHPAAVGEHDAQAARGLLGDDRARPPVLGPAVVRPVALREHPDDEHEDDRDGDRHHARAPAAHLQGELLRPSRPETCPLIGRAVRGLDPRF